MNIGIPKETRPFECRVGLMPAIVQMLTQAGHRFYVERGAGVSSGFRDEDYRAAGAQIVYTAHEAFARADLILKVARPTQQELETLQPGQIVMSFLSLASAQPTKMRLLLDHQVTAIGYETIEDEAGHLPVLSAISEIAGRMTAQTAARLLEVGCGGKGVLLGGLPGVPPAEVAIVGAGMVGTSAIRSFLGLGASIHVLDKDLARLQWVDQHFGDQVITMVAHRFNLEKVLHFADVVVGAILVAGARAPVIITRDMVRSMKPQSLIMDISVDQGGCVETTRPTTLDDPCYVAEGVIHYCVPNMTSAVARTATHALSNAVWPYIMAIATQGLDKAIRQHPDLGRGVNTRNGAVIHPALRQNDGGNIR
ncbi:MAG: alanine dehydrogenase [Chloroflexi bacterium]|nr:alanine dehydrogenase [Chloroflexota bacterium]